MLIMKNKFIVLLLLTIIIGGAAVVVKANSATSVQGIIVSDITWTKENSPYILTGNMVIDNNVTLTIEPGVTVNLNKFYIRINGTLVARGSNTDNIHLNAETSGYIEFTASSIGWNSQFGAGGIIENAVINARLDIGAGSPTINNNTITKRISIGEGSPIISKNRIAIVTIGNDPYSGTNAIGTSNGSKAIIIDNEISGSFTTATIVIGGSPTIQRNRISNSYGYGGSAGYGQAGIFIYSNACPTIRQNTITKNANGISLVDGNSMPIIVYNNIEDNFNYNLFINLGIQVDIDAANNWWGTTDTSVIERKIHDFNDNFDLGKVNYIPFLTSPNPNAMPDPNALIPTPDTSPSSSSPTTTNLPSDSQNPTTPMDQTGTQSGFNLSEIGLFAVAGIIIALLIVNIFFMKRRRTISKVSQA